MTKAKIPENLGSPIAYDPDFNGPRKRRSCTDIVCLLLFLICISCWIGVGIYAFTQGDIRTFLVPKDSQGSRCGVDEHVKNYPYLFFFDIKQCLGLQVPFTGCKTTQICVDSCPTDFFHYNISQGNPKIFCDYENRGKTFAEAKTEHLFESGNCAQWYLASTSVEHRCIPKLGSGSDFSNRINELGIKATDLEAIVKNMKILSRVEEISQKVIEDIISSWWMILIGIAIGLVASLMFILLMRWLAGFMIWFTLIGVLVLLGFFEYFTVTQYLHYKNHQDSPKDEDNFLKALFAKKDTWLVLLIISSIILTIVLLILIFLRKRIVLAIALIREGSKAVSSSTSVLFFPVFQWIFLLGVIAFTLSLAVFLTTTGKPIYKVKINDQACTTCTNKDGVPYKDGAECVPNDFAEHCKCVKNLCKFFGMNNPPLYGYLQAFNVVVGLWGTFFVSALGQMVLASVFATWYWTFRKSKLPFFALTSAFGQTLRYHIGTLAFGSLIITICRLIRICLEYIDYKLKKYENGFTRAILCCCKCFFWCLEKFLKFINCNAYIMCAIHGKNFCTSAKDAFLLIMRNLVRVFVLDKVTDFLLFLGKLFVTLGVGALAYLCFVTDLTTVDNTSLNYNFVPVVIIMVCTYFIASIFFSVYSMAVDTLFLCFLEDCERNDGSPQKPYYMSKNLMSILGKKNKTD